MISVVSAFVPIPDHPRSEAEFHELGDHLLKVSGHIMFARGDLEHCWLYRHMVDNYKPDGFSCSISDNPQKNSFAYHAIQAQKTEWLEAASILQPASDTFVWIDYGIFHVPGVTREIIADFLERADSEQAIAIPGCWKKGFTYADADPCWRFCGGVMVVPRRYLNRFNTAMKAEYIRWLHLTGNISWEVNTLARLEEQDPELPLWWYQADHDQTLFTNYRATELADGVKAKAN